MRIALKSQGIVERKIGLKHAETAPTAENSASEGNSGLPYQPGSALLEIQDCPHPDNLPKLLGTPAAIPKLKTILFTGILPAAAGVWCGALFTAASDDGSPTTIPASSTSSQSIGARPQKRPAATVALPPSFSPEPAKPPESVRERIKNLAANRRVEDLRAELEHLPPGDDRNFAIGLLGKHWFKFDHDATTAWIAGLKDDVEKQKAYGGMVESWTQEDSEAASTWVASLPEGTLKGEVGNSLAIALMWRDPAAALSWTIASRHSPSANSNLASMAGVLARHDYGQAERILAASDLPEAEKRKLRNAAKKYWNQMKAGRGEWDKILTLEATPP